MFLVVVGVQDSSDARLGVLCIGFFILVFPVFVLGARAYQRKKGMAQTSDTSQLTLALPKSVLQTPSQDTLTTPQLALQNGQTTAVESLRLPGAKETGGATIAEVGSSRPLRPGVHPQPTISKAKLAKVRRALSAERDGAARAFFSVVKSDDKQKAQFFETFTEVKLFDAAARGQSEEVEVLLCDGAAPDMIAADTKNAPLHVAVFRGQTLIVELLLRYGANKNVRGGDQSFTPLHLAAEGGRLEIAECLIRHGAEIDARDASNMTPLHYAAGQQSTAVAEVLLANGADANAKSNNGNTPLHMATDKDRQNLARLLLLNKADANARDKLGTTPLHVAAFKGYKGMVELLLAHRPDALAKNDSGRTPLEEARLRKDTEGTKQRNPNWGWSDYEGVIELLREYSAEREDPSVPTLRCAGCSAMYKIGDDALVVTPESGFDLAPSTILISDGTMPDREDLVCSFESVENVERSKEKARQNWTLIENSLARGQRRAWRCRACDKVNTYQ